jgi:hypothetical protein
VKLSLSPASCLIATVGFFFADADAFHMSFCAAHEALVDTEGSLLAKVTLK